MKIKAQTHKPLNRILFFTAVLLTLMNFGWAQGLSDFDQALTKEATSFKSIAKTIFDIIFILGGIGVVYAYVTKRQDARDYLIYYLIGLIVYGVIRQTIMK